MQKANKCIEIKVSELREKTSNQDILRGVDDLPDDYIVYVDPKELKKKQPKKND